MKISLLNATLKTALGMTTKEKIKYIGAFNAVTG